MIIEDWVTPGNDEGLTIKYHASTPMKERQKKPRQNLAGLFGWE